MVLMVQGDDSDYLGMTVFTALEQCTHSVNEDQCKKPPESLSPGAGGAGAEKS